jgi:hypothetical protein
MGKPGGDNTPSLREESQPGELKHLSTRRKRNQIEIPSVAASESGRAQTGSACIPGVEGPMRGLPVWASDSSRSDLERSTGAGESPVGEESGVWMAWVPE